MSSKSDSTRSNKVVDNFTAGRWGFYTPHPPVGFDNLVLDPKTGELVPMPSMTKQEFVDQCDINRIIKEFTITGQVSHISAKAAQGAFIDLPAGLDYQESLNTMIRAQEAFMALPARIRQKFGDDPAQFLDFVADPKNAQELIDLGIRERPLRRPEPAPQESAPSTAATGGSESTPASTSKA